MADRGAEYTQAMHAKMGKEAELTAIKDGLVAMVAGSAAAWAVHTVATRTSDAYRTGPAPLKRILFALATVGSFAAASHFSSARSTYAANDLFLREMEEREAAERAAAAAARRQR